LSLPQSLPKVDGGLQLERWEGDDLYKDGEPINFGVDQVLDLLPLAHVRKMSDNEGLTRALYCEATDLGLLDATDGPFTVELDQEDLSEYIAMRADSEAAVG